MLLMLVNWIAAPVIFVILCVSIGPVKAIAWFIGWLFLDGILRNLTQLVDNLAINSLKEEDIPDMQDPSQARVSVMWGLAMIGGILSHVALPTALAFAWATYSLRHSSNSIATQSSGSSRVLQKTWFVLSQTPPGGGSF